MRTNNEKTPTITRIDNVVTAKYSKDVTATFDKDGAHFHLSINANMNPDVEDNLQYATTNPFHRLDALARIIAGVTK